MKCVVFVIVVFNLICTKDVANGDDLDPSSVVTGDNLKYQFFPVTGSALQFKVRARNDAHIALAMHSQETDPMYEIVIGGWGNTKSVIRKKECTQPDKTEAQTPQYLNENELRGFWIQWDNGIVRAGREGESSPFLSWRDPEPFPIGHVGVHTGFGSTGDWKFKNNEIYKNQSNEAKEKYEVSTGDNTKYQFFPVSGTSLRFNVRAGNDAHIALTTHPFESGPMYEIVIGGWGNTKSVIRKRFCEKPDKDTIETPQFLDEKEFRGFWMRWDKGIVLVGRDGETSPFLSWHDPEPFPVAYVGVHTGFGSSGNWNIDSLYTFNVNL